MQQKASLLADLVGDRKQRRRDIDAAYFGGRAKFSRTGGEEASRPSQSPRQDLAKNIGVCSASPPTPYSQAGVLF
jgi:hypothetical protein